MIIGIPKEIKRHEYRVSMTPDGVMECVRAGHNVLVETQAGTGVGFEDADYLQAGAQIIDTAAQVFEQAELIVKVKEPQLAECERLQPHQTLFTYLHLAADKPQAEALCRSGCLAIAYETVKDKAGRLPLLSPMSEVAGRMSVQVGAQCLEKHNGGRGVLLGGVPGVLPAKVVILGGGVAGKNAAQMAIGARADVQVFDISADCLDKLDQSYGGRLKTVFSTRTAIIESIADADLVIGAVLVPGAQAPRLINRAMLGGMKKGTVLIDIAIDQGGCFETSKPTTHDDPTFVVDGIVHYCVANMPGAVARTSTLGLAKTTLPYILMLANASPREALRVDSYLREGVNVAAGCITHLSVAEALDMAYHPYDVSG